MDVSWSCDGQHIGVSCADGTVCLFKTQQAEEPGQLQPFGANVAVGMVRFLAVSGELVVIVGAADNSEIQMWNLNGMR